jgi:glycosyltransferase involved in cell wall biosynthesis
MATVLAQSFKSHHSEDFYIFILDDDDYKLQDLENIYSIIRWHDLGIDGNEIAKMRMLYDVMEFATAIKPFVIEYLIKNGYSAVLYFDPDIEIFESIGEIFESVNSGKIFLTPHITYPMAIDEKSPGEYDFLISGIYNLGFIGVPKIRLDFLNFWKDRLRRHCISDISNALFVDQRWIDFVPGMYDTHISRYPGYNVAYWNINQRDITLQNNKYFVNGQSLKFFHFSGFNPLKPYILSKYQTLKPRKPVVKNPPINMLCQNYAKSLINSGFIELSKTPYEYNLTPSGIKLTQPIRRLYREYLLDSEDPEKQFEEPPNPFIDSESKFIEWLNSPAPTFGQISSSSVDSDENVARSVRKYIIHILKRADGISRQIKQYAKGRNIRDMVKVELTDVSFEGLNPTIYQRELWKLRTDLQSAFPSPCEANRVDFLKWVKNHGTKEGVPNELSLGTDIKSNFFSYDKKQDSFITLSKSFWRETPIRQPGINLIGNLTSESSTGKSARTLLETIKLSGLDYCVFDNKSTVFRKSVKLDDWGSDLSNYKTNIMVLNADMIVSYVEALGPSCFKNHRTITLSAWELENMPMHLAKNFDLVDEVWSNSNFTKETIQKVTDREVYSFSLPVSVPILDDSYSRDMFDIPKDKFVFLFCFDFLSELERKNPLGLIEAYTKAFREDEDSILVLKSVNSSFVKKKASLVFEEVLQRKDIILIDQYFSDNQVSGIINDSNAYISMHRAEGFGLTMAESMILGKPTIATGYSGNLDFMNNDNSFLIPYKKVLIPDTAAPYKGCGYWADPIIDDAVDLMREVKSMSSMVEEKSKKGQKDVLISNSVESKVEFLRQRINAS